TKFGEPIEHFVVQNVTDVLCRWDDVTVLVRTLDVAYLTIVDQSGVITGETIGTEAVTTLSIHVALTYFDIEQTNGTFKFLLCDWVIILSRVLCVLECVCFDL